MTVVFCVYSYLIYQHISCNFMGKILLCYYFFHLVGLHTMPLIKLCSRPQRFSYAHLKNLAGTGDYMPTAVLGHLCHVLVMSHSDGMLAQATDIGQLNSRGVFQVDICILGHA